MRIVGGELRGRRIAAPLSPGIRPTADRIREALFNVLEHRFTGCIPGARVLDLFAGTGALGLEALSRGAQFCLFVDDNVPAGALVNRNITAFGFQERARFARRDATRLSPQTDGRPFDLLFADPPYGKGLAERALRAARNAGWLHDRTLCVVEEAVGYRFDPDAGFHITENRTYGTTELHFVEFKPPSNPEV